MGEELRLTGSSRQLREIHSGGALRDKVLGRGSIQAQKNQTQENHVQGPRGAKLLEKANRLQVEHRSS